MIAMILGWVGNFERPAKNFKLAQNIATQLLTSLKVAGPKGHQTHRHYHTMPEFYRDIDVLLVTSKSEAHPLVVYEALACGKPVVMERGVGDCYVEGVRGIRYYEGFNRLDIEDAIDDAYEHREALGDAGVRCIQKEWTWEHFVDDYVRMFEFIAKPARPLIAVNEHDWCWDYMAQDIQKYVPLPIDIFYADDYRNMMQFDFSPYNVVLNHIWHRLSNFHHPYYDMRKNVVSVNGPGYIFGEKIFKVIVDRSPAISTVSKAMMPELKLYGKPLFHCTRGVDTELFHP